MKTQLEELQKSLNSLLSVEDASETHEVAVMTAEEFLLYAADQVEKAKGEADDEAKARLDHLLKNVNTFISKNAFDGNGTAFPLFRGEQARQSMTAYSDFAGDHTEKQGQAISHSAANTEANPASNAFGRGGPQHDGGAFSFRGKVGKAAAQELAKAINADTDFRDSLIAALSGDASEPEAAQPTEKSDEKPEPAQQPLVWPRDLNADEVDGNLKF